MFELITQRMTLMPVVISITLPGIMRDLRQRISKADSADVVLWLQIYFNRILVLPSLHFQKVD